MRADMVNGEYQQEHRQQIISYLRANGCAFRNCIDVGAHVGLWSRDLASLFQRVYAFEPIPHLRQCFKQNVLAENVILHDCGLGSRAGTMKFDYDLSNTGATHVNPEGDVESKISTLDDFDFDQIDYIKVDTEGYELEVMRGAERLLTQQSPFVHLEMKNRGFKKFKTDKSKVTEWMATKGYHKVFKTVNEVVFKKDIN